MREVSEIDWAAGFWDGEGCACNHQCGNSDKYLGVTLRVKQSNNTEVLERFQKAVGFGKITGPYLNGGHRRNSWQWSTARKADVVKFYKLMKGRIGSIKIKQLKYCMKNADLMNHKGRIPKGVQDRRRVRHNAIDIDAVIQKAYRDREDR